MRGTWRLAFGSVLGVAVAVGACSSKLGSGSSDGGDAGALPPREISCAPGDQNVFRPGPAPSAMPCAPDGSCPDGQVCFRLSDELAVCDVAQRIYPDAGCTPACDEGKVCFGTSGGCWPVSRCWETPCESPADCGEGTVCAPPSSVAPVENVPLDGTSRCMPRSCKSDRDCTRGSNGRCAYIALTFGGCNSTTGAKMAVGCVYSGALDCPGGWTCGDGSYHACPGPDGGTP